MRITAFRRRPRFVAAFAALLGFAACGRKPVTTVSAVPGCGPLPVRVMLCIETLPTLSTGEIDRTRVTQADLQRCMVNSVDQLIGENQQLRKQFAPCAR